MSKKKKKQEVEPVYDWHAFEERMHIRVKDKLMADGFPELEFNFTYPDGRHRKGTFVGISAIFNDDRSRRILLIWDEEEHRLVTINVGPKYEL